MRKLLFCGTLLLLACAPAAAQDSEALAGAPDARLDAARGEAARLLESQANSERAWGAYLAGRGELKELEPALVRTLSDPALADGPEGKLVRQAALDALIRLGAKVPAEHLRALPQDFADEVIILLSLEPTENREALMELFATMAGDSGPEVRWLAVGNLLAETKARGFAPLLLRDLKVEADVAVKDWDGSYGFGVGGGGGCGGGGSDERPAGFPPVNYYALTGDARRGAAVVAPGKYPVFYVRSTNRYVSHGYTPAPVRDVVRVEYLAGLLEKPDLDFDARPSESVVCEEAQQCRRGLIGLRARIEQSYAAMVGLLVEKGHLGAAGDAPASPPISFTLWDNRRLRTFPLPDKLKGVTIVINEAEPEESDAAEDAGVEEP